MNLEEYIEMRLEMGDDYEVIMAEVFSMLEDSDDL